MGRVIFMGKTGSGKTTLCQALDKLELKYRKTQAIEVYDRAIDTPGEYIENRGFYNALIVTAVDADIIAFVYDCTSDENYMAPGFAGIFCKKVIGIITKINKVENSENVKMAEERLTLTGVEKIFKVDTVEGIGIKELFDYLERN